MNLRAIAVAALIALAPAAAVAANVRVTTQDGNVISGDLVSSENGAYRIQTPYGLITVPVAAVRNFEKLGGAASGAAGQPEAPLRLAGSTTIGDAFAPALLQGFAARTGATEARWRQGRDTTLQLLSANGQNGAKHFSAELSRRGSATAFTGLGNNWQALGLSGPADIGMASRRVNPAEVATLRPLGELDKPAQEHVLALDAVVLLVNRGNPVRTLSIGQIRDIFACRITDWSQLGGPAMPIHPVGRDEQSGTHDTFMMLVMGSQKPCSRIAVMADNEAVSETVGGDPGAIGYAGFATIGSNRALDIATDCGLSFAADEILVRTEEYPLSRRLYLYTPAHPGNSAIGPFIDFALNQGGQAIAKKLGFVDLVPQVMPTLYGRNQASLTLANLADNRAPEPQDLTDLLSYARWAVNGNRVTVTFRFEPGSAELDSRAVRDLDRLAEFLKSPLAARRSILAAGFSDTAGSLAESRDLSAKRATLIAAQLRQRGVSQIEVGGFGRIAPVACNTTPEGQQKNRRVEIWLR